MSGPSSRKKEPERHVPVHSAKKYRPGGSCAECKRLKIKCKKNIEDSFPCNSCIRRGCQAICPEGSLTPGKAGRFVLANTEELHKKILELSNRIRDLEDALRELQATFSTESHPLLRDDLLLLKAPLEREAVLLGGETSLDLDGLESLNALGSLSLRTSGRSNFHAQTAGSWYLLQNEDPDPSAPHGDKEDNVMSFLSADMLCASHAFPIVTFEDIQSNLRTRIEKLIPDLHTGLRLVQNYFHGMAWMYDPVPRAHFDETIFNVIYTGSFPLIRNCDSTILAVLYIVLAIGTLLDLEIPNYSSQATRYYQLSRAALSLDLVLDEPSLSTIQALHLMGFFLHMSDSKGGFGTSWALMGLNSKLGIGIGLHRDGSNWGLGSEEAIRRQLFWELYTYDTWQSMPSGRPPSFQRLSIDCKMPYEALLAQGASIDDPSAVFKAWKHRFCYERISPMVEQSFGPRTPAYATILALDRRIREDPIPPLLQLTSSSPSCDQQHDHLNMTLTMQRYTVLCVREISLLLMHRPFFAQAATEKAPLENKFAPSILAIYRSSCAIIAGVRDLYDQHPGLSPRVWFFWAHVFSATICLGGLVARCPSLSLAPSALAQVESACELFGRVTGSNRTSKSLPSMLKLRDKARQALADHRAGQKAPLAAQQRQDELSALVGETRLVVHRAVRLSSTEQSARDSGNARSLNYTSTESLHPHLPPFIDTQVPLHEAVPIYVDQEYYTHPTYANEVAISQYQTGHNPSYGQYEFGQHWAHMHSRDVVSATHGLQEEYHYPVRSALKHTEQQVFMGHVGRDEAWQNFMSHLEMDFS